MQMGTPHSKSYCKHSAHAALCVLVAALFLQAALPLSAQSANAVPVPAQFATAHTVFLASGAAPGAGGKEVLIAQMVYSSFYKSLSAAGRYRLVSTPDDAELSMVISTQTAMSDVMKGDSVDESYLRLEIFDVRTHSLLWTIDEPLNGAFREKTFQKNVDKSVAAIMSDLNSLASGAVPGKPGK
ncbi:MAG: hypothetical protein ACRD28_09775, partial [Acidobacteriaceae bacterium]